MRTLIYTSLLVISMLLPQTVNASQEPTPFKENPAWMLLKTDMASYGIDATHAVTESNEFSAYFDILCNTDHSLEINFAWTTPVNTEKKSIDISIKIDNKPSTQTFFLKGDQMIAFVNNPKAFLSQLYGHKTLEITIPFVDLDDTQIIFDIKNLNQIVNSLETSCK